MYRTEYVPTTRVFSLKFSKLVERRNRGNVHVEVIFHVTGERARARAPSLSLSYVYCNDNLLAIPGGISVSFWLPRASVSGFFLCIIRSYTYESRAGN